LRLPDTQRQDRADSGGRETLDKSALHQILLTGRTLATLSIDANSMLGS
jgi:hypothetical protein